MPQDVFDTCVLVLAKAKVESGGAGRLHVLTHLQNGYQNVYVDDFMFLQDIDKVSGDLINSSAGKVSTSSLDWAIKERMSLDKNMQEKNALKRFFGGALFNNGDADFQRRKELSLLNVKALLKKVGESFSRPLKKSVRVQKVVISGVPHPLPTPEKSLVGRSGRSGFGGVSFLRTFSTAC